MTEGAPASNGSALEVLVERIDGLRAKIAEQNEDAARIRELVTHEREAFQERRAEVLERQREVEARAETIMGRDPRLAYLAPLRVMLVFAARCTALGEAVKADLYLAHDDVSLMAAHQVSQAQGGKIVYDAAEFPDRRQRFGLFRHTWPGPALELFNMTQAPIIRSCAFTLTGGDPIGDHITRTFGVPSHTIYNSRPDICESFDPSVRDQLGLEQSDTLLLYVNTVSHGSLFETLIEGLTQLDDSYHLAVLGLVRPGLQEPFERLARESGVAERLHFLGVAPWDDMPRVASGADAAVVSVDPRMANCRMFVHNRYFDAIAAGLPIFGSFNIGARKVFKDQPFFFEFDVLDPRDFARVVNASDIRSVDRGRVVEFAKKTAWQTQIPFVQEIFDSAETVTILAIKDVAEHHRTLRIAEALAAAGKQVNVVCRRVVKTEPEIENVHWHRLANVY
jgi:glycosyltransferase involved in cell wall biosynthesis